MIFPTLVGIGVSGVSVGGVPGVIVGVVSVSVLVVFVLVLVLVLLADVGAGVCIDGDDGGVGVCIGDDGGVGVCTGGVVLCCCW